MTAPLPGIIAILREACRCLRRRICFLAADLVLQFKLCVYLWSAERRRLIQQLKGGTAEQ